MKHKFFLVFLILLSSSPLLADPASDGIQVVEGASLSKAIGHYSRARHLLLSALKEFDRGAAIASPEVLLDQNKWRDSVSSLADDLTVILNPQPRVSKEGVINDADIKIFDNLK